MSRQSAHKSGKVFSSTHWPPLPPGNIPGTHFCQRLSQPQGHSGAGRIMSMKNSNDTIGNRSRDLPTCSAVPRPTALPRAPKFHFQSSKISSFLLWSKRVNRLFFLQIPTGLTSIVVLFYFLKFQILLPCKRMGTGSALYTYILENFRTKLDLKVLFRIPSI